MSDLTKAQRDLRSRQMNPCDDLYWKSRGYSCRPDNWQELLEQMGYYQQSPENSDDEEYSEEEYYSEDETSDDESYEDDDDIYQEQLRQELQLRSRMMNPCDSLYWKSRGYPDRPRNWQQLVYG